MKTQILLALIASAGVTPVRALRQYCRDPHVPLNCGDAVSLRRAFVDRQGKPRHGAFIVMVCAPGKAQIRSEGKPLLDALCAHRQIPCISNHPH